MEVDDRSRTLSDTGYTVEPFACEWGNRHIDPSDAELDSESLYGLV